MFQATKRRQCRSRTLLLPRTLAIASRQSVRTERAQTEQIVNNAVLGRLGGEWASGRLSARFVASLH